MNDGNLVYVKIGEVKIGKPGDLLKATLGSCVGIAFVWKEKKLFALAHCLLPESPDHVFLEGAKYVNQAIPSLMTLLQMSDVDKDRIEVYVAGGGNMMLQSSGIHKDHIGQQNIRSAHKYLKEYGFKFKELSAAGNSGVQILVDCTSGDVSIITLKDSHLPKLEE